MDRYYIKLPEESLARETEKYTAWLNAKMERDWKSIVSLL